MKKFETLLGINISIALFGPCEEVAKALQQPTLCAADAQQAVEALGEAISRLHSEVAFDELWLKTLSTARQIGLKEPKVTRPTRPQSPSEPAALVSKTTMRKEFFTAIDRMMSKIQCQFKQPGIDKLVNLERTLTNAARGQAYAPDELQKNLGTHGDDFMLPRLSVELTLLPSLLSKVDTATVESIIHVPQKKSEGVLEIFDQVMKYLQLLLSTPATAASGECSFSALRQIKTYLRSRMTQSTHAPFTFTCPHGQDRRTGVRRDRKQVRQQDS